MRVLFTSQSAWGHIHPIVPLARAVQARGHDVRWATGPDSGPHVEQAGIAAIAAGLSLRDRTAEFGARFPEVYELPPHRLPDEVFPKMFGMVTAPHTLRDLLPFVRDVWTPDLVVHDAAEFAGAIAATVVGAPHVTHGFGSVTPQHRVAAAGDAVVPLWRSVGLDPLPFGGSYEHLYLDIYPPSLQHEPHDHIPQRQLLQPVQYNSAAGSEAEAWEPPSTTRPLVYLTFGTIFNGNEALRTALEALARLPVDLLVTVGPNADPASFGPQPAHVRVERYLPQLEVLPHCALVVSHCGSGTFLGALTEGLPQLCLPQGADQFLNSAGCEQVGAGLVLRPEEATVDAIERAAATLLADPSYATAARAVRREIASMPSPDEVAAVLEALG